MNSINDNDQLIVMVDTCSNDEPLTLLESIDTPSGPNTGAVLATLDGPVMDYVHATRNERLYEEELCDMIHDSEYVAELEATNNFLGEPDHPMSQEKRLDVHYPYVSHAIRNFRKVPEKGCYYATFDILDTPQGRILKTLIDYGVNLGVSSRGSGRTITKNGRVVVDKNTYRFITFDIVHMPGNKIARLPQANESVTNHNAQSLTEQIDNLIASNDIEQLRSVLPVLNFLSESQDLGDLVERVESSISALNESNTITETSTDDLLEAYSTIRELKSDISSKDSIIESLMHRVSSLEESIKEVQGKNSELQERYSKSADLAKAHLSREQDARCRVESIQSKLDKALSENAELVESARLISDQLEEKDSEIQDLTERLRLSERSALVELSSLRKQIDSQEVDLNSITEQLHYTDHRCNEAVAKYFSLRCNQLGLKEAVVLRSLGNDLSRYSLDEIDSSLQEAFLAKSSSPRAAPILESIGKTTRVSTIPSKYTESNRVVSDITDICRSVKNS